MAFREALFKNKKVLMFKCIHLMLLIIYHSELSVKLGCIDNLKFEKTNFGNEEVFVDLSESDKWQLKLYL